MQSENDVNMKSSLIGIALATSCAMAHAGLIQVGGAPAGANGKITAKENVCAIDFNGGNASNDCGITFTQSVNGAPGPLAASHFRSGASSSAAAPAGDSTIFLTVGPSDGTPITLTLATPADYFGFFTGSLDAYNRVQFFRDGSLVDSFTGDAINAVAFPNMATNGDRAAAQYIDYFAGSFVNGQFVAAFYDTIVYSSSSDAFETDNHAFGLAIPVPEPASLSLFGLGALAFAATRRRGSRRG